MIAGTKRMYLAVRHPALSPDAFVTRWRTHGALAMSFMARQQWENVTRYVHCDALRDHGLEGIAPDFDGVGMISFRDAEARKRHIGNAYARAVLEADEDDTFAMRVNRRGFVAAETVFIERSDPEIALVRVIRRNRQMSPEAFAAVWKEERVRELDSMLGDQLCRYVQDWPLSPPENGKEWGLDCDLVDELWFRGVDALRRAWTGHRAILSLGNDNTCESALALAVRKAVLYPG